MCNVLRLTFVNDEATRWLASRETLDWVLVLLLRFFCREQYGLGNGTIDGRLRRRHLMKEQSNLFAGFCRQVSKYVYMDGTEDARIRDRYAHF